MSNFPIEILSSERIASLEQDITEEAEAGRKDGAWQKLQPLRQAQHHQYEATNSLLRIIGQRCLSIDGAADVLLEIAQSHPQDTKILATVGECLEAAHDIDELNAPPPAHAVFHTVIERLATLAREQAGLPQEEDILRGLATAARMLARQYDDIAESSYRKLTEINPRKGAHHYNLGLFFKTRGKFAEGMKSNQVAASLADKTIEADETIDAYEWNLGICATGSGNGSVALDVWKQMGQEIEMGRFGLPEGSYPHAKVKVAQRPLAERSADLDDPGLEETIWIERLSPCHGIIRSVLYEELGVDYGDVILIDGAPITHHTYGDKQVPVFPHLATLVRRKYKRYDFAGTQHEARQLADADIELDGDSVIYPHSEYLRQFCARCWRDPDVDHDQHEQVERRIVVGRIAAAPDVDPAQLLDQIDKALARRSGCQLYVPDLCLAAGFQARASVEKRRFDLLTRNEQRQGSVV
jgi:tetratricopeptide (TPR) repeat protein